MAKLLTPQEIEQLPLLKVRYGNEIISVRYDTGTKRMYKLNKDLEWTGTFVEYNLDSLLEAELQQGDVSQAAVSPGEQPPAPEPISTAGPAPQENGAAQEPERDSETNSDEDPPKKKRKSILFPILAGVLAIVIGLAVWGSVRGKLQAMQGNGEPTISPTQAQQETAGTSETEALAENSAQPSEESEVTVQVLAPKSALVPGQPITPEVFENVTLTEVEFRKLSSAEGLYTTGELNAMEGMVIVNYVPAGRYLTYSDVGKEYAPANPWAADNTGVVTYTLPVAPSAENLKDYNWNNLVDITITIQTKQTNENEQQDDEDATEPAGVEHESSVVESMVVDTYKLQGVKIIDILNPEQTSLFNRYSALSSIPSALQEGYLKDAYQDNETLKKDLPAYIIVAVTSEQAGSLEGLNQEALRVEIGNPVASNTTSLQNDMYGRIREAESSICAVWSAITEASADNG